ncbi:hypothetical protein L208DRAFT_1402472 [Tricholoma matsutake]|nr:hypothetical protein L208DRAFT_1402472 [Tricholoma matsutake 945]
MVVAFLCGLSIMHTICSIVFVASGLSILWPDAFGKWADAYTIRGFWGSSNLMGNMSRDTSCASLRATTYRRIHNYTPHSLSLPLCTHLHLTLVPSDFFEHVRSRLKTRSLR